MKSLILGISCLMLMAISINSAAQTGCITGNLVDAHGRPVANAAIEIQSWQGAIFCAESDSVGSYWVTDIPAGVVTAKIDHGFDRIEVALIPVFGDEPITVDEQLGRGLRKKNERCSLNLVTHIWGSSTYQTIQSSVPRISCGSILIICPISTIYRTFNEAGIPTHTFYAEDLEHMPGQ